MGDDGPPLAAGSSLIQLTASPLSNLQHFETVTQLTMMPGWLSVAPSLLYMASSRVVC
jgi:hypothetical protein